MSSTKRIGLRDIRALGPNETIWDSAVTGFGARRQRSAAVAYLVVYRGVDGRQRWFTIGRHGSPWTPDTARDEARRLLGDVAHGADPAAEKRKTRKAKTISELCDLYLADAENGRLLTRRKTAKTASTLASDRGRIERHIKPLLGRLSVIGISREDIENFLHEVAEGRTACTEKTRSRGLARVRGGKGVATRTVGLLGGIFSYAVQHRMRADNPVHGVVRFADGRRERRLTDKEYASLGEMLRSAETRDGPPFAIAAARFLALTGWRRGEVLGLKWSEIDLDRRTARLIHTKTGYSARALSLPACALLSKLPRTRELVFPASRGDGLMTGFQKTWTRMAAAGGMAPDVSAHVLRHSFASAAADLGLSEFTIAALIGHKGHSITSRYVHGADVVLLAAADKVSRHIEQLLGDMPKRSEAVPIRAALAA